VLDADTILVLVQGRVTQRGTHAELVAQPGLYRRLWEIQSAHDLGDDEISENARGAEATHVAG
jgi:ABC-type transport system involved in cytochrome bd biosynthesis fused ATPase/permease subunit